MKHEQLLVQYGMVRACGLRSMEVQAELESKRRELAGSRQEAARLRERFARETALLRRSLREAELEVQGRGLEIAALREKIRALELLTRTPAPPDAIERQFAQLGEQLRVVDRLSSRQRDDSTAPPRIPAAPNPGTGSDH